MLDTTQSSFERALAAHVLGHLPGDEVPGVALLALELGHDTLDMAALAAEPTSTHPADLRHAFDVALRDVGLALPSRRDAAERLKRAFAMDGCTGVLSPYNAARAILDVYRTIESELPTVKGYLGEAFDIADLVAAFWSLGDSRADGQPTQQEEAELIEALQRIGRASG